MLTIFIFFSILNSKNILFSKQDFIGWTKENSYYNKKKNFKDKEKDK